MTRTAAVARGLAVVASAAVSVALLTGAAPAPSATTDATTVAQAATTAKATKTSKAKSTKAKARAAKARTASTRAAAAATDFTSIFAGQQPQLANAGWASCAAPIVWTVDTSALGTEQAARQVANLRAAFDQWADASGLSFTYDGTATFRFDESAFTLTATDGATPAQRSISLAFIDDADTDLLGGTTVGMAGPTTVWASSKEIASGTGIFRTDAVKKMTDSQARALFTHELGHVLGLGHADGSGNIMYPVVGSAADLGAGDVTGVRTMTKPCAA